MKKVLSLILSLMLMLGMCSLAFASASESADFDAEEAELFAELDEEKADADEDVAEAIDTIGSVDLVSFDQSFVAVCLINKETKVAMLNVDGNNVRGCYSNDQGIVKLNRTENDAKTICVVLNNTEFKAKDVKDIENTNGVVLEFFLGDANANKDFVLYNEKGDAVELKADADGFCAVSVADAAAFALIEKSDDALSFADVVAAEVENQENENAGQENKSNLPITIAFFCLLALGGGYLVWDKFFKGRNKSSDDDEE